LDLTTAQRQRAIGAVMGMAIGDALGAGYEFGPALATDAPVGMIGSGVFAPGEWTDDTSMAIPILQALAEGRDLLDRATMDRVAAAWYDWSLAAKDVGIHTSEMMHRAPKPITAEGLTRTAAAKFAAGRNSAGNGTLMRTTPIVLGYHDDPAGLTRAATTYSLLTHGDPVAAQACVLWNHAQRHAIETGELDIRVGLAHLDRDAAATWSALLDEAEAAPPVDFHTGNGWVVRALQAAWSAIAATPIPEPDTSSGRFPADHFADALRTAVRVGNDADTVAAIGGGLLGARWGVSAIPAAWRRPLHGWPGMTGQELLRLTGLALTGGSPDGQGWPMVGRLDYSNWQLRGAVVRHPRDAGVWIGDVAALDSRPPGVDAVVSLCRLGTAQSPAPGVAAADHVEVWLIDAPERSENPHLEFVLRDTVRTIADLRAEGRTVLLHCVAGESRTPTVAALYGAKAASIPVADALTEVLDLLPQADPNQTFREVLQGW
jgi:ADP-ribosyl-[dinitrogen reductase] hydrolase